ncbi:MAG TPA: sigma-70 family RNA polymerase sigma factor [Pirellulales bacterium]
MGEPPETRASLLLRIRNPQDGESWVEFTELYAPVVFRAAKRRRLQDADAADLTQDVLLAVARTADRLHYDPSKGSFRGWLYRVTQNKLNDHCERQKRLPASREPAELAASFSDDASDEEAWWDREYQERLFRWAADRVRPHCEPTTWSAFWRTSVEGQSPAEAAAALGLSIGTVYAAKSRVLARIRKEIQTAELI